MPIVIYERRAPVIAFHVGDELTIDLFGEHKRVRVKAIDIDTVTVEDKNEQTDVLAYDDVKAVINVSALPPSESAPPSQLPAKWLCFNVPDLSNCQLVNMSNSQVGIVPKEMIFEYSPADGAAGSTPVLGGAVCRTPDNYNGETTPVTAAGGQASFVTAVPAGILTSQETIGGSASHSTIVLLHAPDSNVANGTTFIRQYTNAPTSENAVPLDI